MLDVVLKRLHHRPVAYYPIYADIMGSISGGVILSQVLYWYSAVEGNKFFKTDAEIRKETRASEWELKEAKRKFKTLPFLKITVEGLPARTFYEVDAEALATYIYYQSESQNPPASLEDTDEPVGRPSPNQLGGPLQTYNTTENTTETTTDILLAQRSKKSTAPPAWPDEDQWISTFIQTQTLAPIPLKSLNDPLWWEQVSYTTNGLDLPFLEKEFAKMGAWVKENPRRLPTPNGWKRFVRGWLERSYEKERRFNVQQKTNGYGSGFRRQ